MLKMTGVLTSISSNTDKKTAEVKHYGSILSPDGQSLAKVRLKPEKLVDYAKLTGKEILLDVKVSCYNNNIYFNEV